MNVIVCGCQLPILETSKGTKLEVFYFHGNVLLSAVLCLHLPLGCSNPKLPLVMHKLVSEPLFILQETLRW